MTRAGWAAGWAVWYGWVLCFVFTLAPLLGWLSPLGFTPLAVLGGLLSLRAFQVSEADRPAALAILVLCLWALVSTIWSPFKPTEIGNTTGFKLLAGSLFYWALFRSASAADADVRALALRIFTWGVAAFGLVILIEALTGAAIYKYLREATGDPIRPDLAIRNVAQGGFVLAVLAPAAAVAGWRVGAGLWPAIAIALGIGGASFGLEADAPIIALVLSLLAGWAVCRWPVATPRVLGGAAALLMLAAPWLVLAARSLGWLQALHAAVPLSWQMRLDYWGHAADRILADPLRGWGVDASRTFGPDITLHPHNGALQVWLELGLIGAVAAAVFWAVAIARQSSQRADLGRAAAVGTAMAYLTFASVSFGVWQDWWLALGAVAATACLAVQKQGLSLEDWPARS
ncbi:MULTISPECIES: O-antigen ligase family protein [Phenylobacterium]|uniref:O-antigen ligase n=1 Tax=Phenylobacterium koreense TaxID=266125 RepID=A0ABV2EF67_9CAUL